jgi:hypothetical protein
MGLFDTDVFGRGADNHKREEANPSGDQLAAFTNTISAIVAQNQSVMKTLADQSHTSEQFDTFALAITSASGVVSLIGYDLSRRRMLLRASVDQVYVGKRDQLAGGLGYLLPLAAGDEFKHTDEMFVKYVNSDPTVTALIYVHVEKDLESN